MTNFEFIEVETEDGYKQVSASYDPVAGQIKMGDSSIVVSQSEVEALLAQKDKENAAIAAELRKQLEEKSWQEAKAHTDLISKRIHFFSDEFELTIHKRSFMVAAAPSGHGKSTFAKQSAAHAVMGNRKVLIISNELPVSAYMASISEKYAGMAGIPTREAFSKVFDNVIVEDMYTSKGMSQGWMTCVQYMFNMIKKHKPDLVFLDQLSNATLDIGYTGKEKVPDYKKFELIAADIQNRIHTGTEDWPPIIAFQQMMPPADSNPLKWSMKNLLRDSKNTMNYATHSLMILKKKASDDSVRTLLVVDKVRYEYSYGKSLSLWKMDGNWILRKADDED